MTDYRQQMGTFSLSFAGVGVVGLHTLLLDKSPVAPAEVTAPLAHQKLAPVTRDGRGRFACHGDQRAPWLGAVVSIVIGSLLAIQSVSTWAWASAVAGVTLLVTDTHFWWPVCTALSLNYWCAASWIASAESLEAGMALMVAAVGLRGSVLLFPAVNLGSQIVHKRLRGVFFGWCGWAFATEAIYENWVDPALQRAEAAVQTKQSPEARRRVLERTLATLETTDYAITWAKVFRHIFNWKIPYLEMPIMPVGQYRASVIDLRLGVIMADIHRLEHDDCSKYASVRDDANESIIPHVTRRGLLSADSYCDRHVFRAYCTAVFQAAHYAKNKGDLNAIESELQILKNIPTLDKTIVGGAKTILAVGMMNPDVRVGDNGGAERARRLLQDGLTEFSGKNHPTHASFETQALAFAHQVQSEGILSSQLNDLTAYRLRVKANFLSPNILGQHIPNHSKKVVTQWIRNARKKLVKYGQTYEAVAWRQAVCYLAGIDLDNFAIYQQEYDDITRDYTVVDYATDANMLAYKGALAWETSPTDPASVGAVDAYLGAAQIMLRHHPDSVNCAVFARNALDALVESPQKCDSGYDMGYKVGDIMRVYNSCQKTTKARTDNMYDLVKKSRSSNTS